MGTARPSVPGLSAPDHRCVSSNPDRYYGETPIILGRLSVAHTVRLIQRFSRGKEWTMSRDGILEWLNSTGQASQIIDV